MVQKIIWNKTAQRSFDQIINYLHDEYSINTAEKFFKLVYRRIGQLTEQPYIGRPTKKAKLSVKLTLINIEKCIIELKGVRSSLPTFLILAKTLIKNVFNFRMK